MNSEKTTYKAGQVPSCPHCSKLQEDPIEDFVVSGRVGSASRCATECCWCY